MDGDILERLDEIRPRPARRHPADVVRDASEAKGAEEAVYLDVLGRGPDGLLALPDALHEEGRVLAAQLPPRAVARDVPRGHDAAVHADRLGDRHEQVLFARPDHT